MDFLFSFRVLTASHELVHIAQFTWVSKLLSAGLALHCMHQCPAIDSFPIDMAWEAKSPMRKTLVVGMWPGVAFELGLQWRYLTTSTPLSFSVNKCNWNIEMIFRPLVNCWSIASSSRCPMTLRHISSHIDTSKSMMRSLDNLTDRPAKLECCVAMIAADGNLNTRRTSVGMTDLLDRCLFNSRVISSSKFVSVHSTTRFFVWSCRWYIYNYQWLRHESLLRPVSNTLCVCYYRPLII